jgi:phage tail-like protein
MQAARFGITIDGYEIAQFSELQGITTDVKPVEGHDLGSWAKAEGLDVSWHATRSSLDRLALQSRDASRPLMLRLSRPRVTDARLFGWHRSAVQGKLNARKSAAVVLYDYAGKPVAKYRMTNAWPSKIEMKYSTGPSRIMTEEVTLTFEHIRRE